MSPAGSKIVDKVALVLKIGGHLGLFHMRVERVLSIFAVDIRPYAILAAYVLTVHRSRCARLLLLSNFAFQRRFLSAPEEDAFTSAIHAHLQFLRFAPGRKQFAAGQSWAGSSSSGSAAWTSRATCRSTPPRTVTRASLTRYACARPGPRRL